MKKSVLLLLLVCVSCQTKSCSQNTQIAKVRTTQTDTILIASDTTMKPLQKFDIDRFNQHSAPEDRDYVFENSNGDNVHQFGDSIDGYVEYIRRSGEVFEQYNEYYPTGALKITGYSYPNDFNYGIWRYYDEEGNLVEEVDNEVPYKYTWEDVRKFTTNNKIDLFSKFTNIRRAYDNRWNGYVWRISWRPNIEINQGKTVILSGETGKILEDKEMEYLKDTN